MLRTAEEGNIKLGNRGLVDWVIRADETISEEAMPEAQPAEGAIESVAAGEEVLPDTVTEEATEAVPETTETGRRTSRARTKAEPETVDEVQPEAPEAEAVAESLSEAPEAEADASTDTISVTSEDPTETEAASDATEAVVEDAPVPALSPELEKVLEETLAQLELPRGPGDGQDGRRIADLVIMADMLEHQEGITHVAFNFLLSEICGALQQGLEAEHPEITSRWGGRTYSRTYVTRLLRELGDKEVFLRDWHQEKSEETGRTRRFRTFNLNRTNPLVKEAVVSQWGPDTDSVPPEAETAALVPEDDTAVASSNGHSNAVPEPEGEPAVAAVE